MYLYVFFFFFSLLFAVALVANKVINIIVIISVMYYIYKVSACNMNTVGNMDIPCKSSSLSCDLYIPVYIS